MIGEIETALKEIQIAIAMCKDDDTLGVLKQIEQRLKNWLYTYVDDGK
jgi:hypothetical protein